MELTAVLIYCLVREVFFIYSINKLTNKIMSKNYYDYEISGKLGKHEKEKQKEKEIDRPEDLRALQEFSL